MKDTLHIACHYFRYKLFARHKKGHGIHSPFLYNFIVQVLGNKIEKDFYAYNKNNEKTLKANKTKLKVNDYGAGSKGKKNEIRSISLIASSSSTTFKYRCLLSKIVEHYKPELILELGTSLGLTTNILSCSTRNSVTTLEGCPNIHKAAIENFNQWNNKNIEAICTNFDAYIDKLEKQANPVLVYIDGNHTGRATQHYVNTLWSKIPPESIIIIDDIYWSRDMTESWKQIIRPIDNRYTVDLFHFGILFKLSLCKGQHFCIRY